MPIGAHVSIAGSRVPMDEHSPPYDDLRNAVHRQVAVGGTCGQIFTTSPRVWATPSIDPETADAFRSETDEYLSGPWVIHAAYLVNLATPRSDLREKSVAALQADLAAADTLGIPYVNVHLGAHTGAGVDAGLENAVAAIDDLEIPPGVTLLLETDAGSGSKLGGSFEHLAVVRERSRHDLAVCLDTAHTFVAGYDLGDSAAVAATIETFDEIVGLEHLAYIHLNDSKHPLGSHRDEHAHLGEGHIGQEGIEAVLTHPELRGIPVALETPREDGRGFAWNIERARAWRGTDGN